MGRSKHISLSALLAIALCMGSCFQHRSHSGTHSREIQLGAIHLSSTDAYAFSSFEVERLNWDDYRVDATMIRSSKGVQVTPDAYYIALEKENGEVVFETNHTEFTYFDGNWGSETTYTLKCCAIFNNSKTCREKRLKASRKAIAYRTDIDYPIDKSIFLGSYEVDVTVSRAKFRDPLAFEPIQPSQFQAYNLAVFSSRENSLRLLIPLAGQHGQFDLRKDANYVAFKSQIEKEINTGSGVQVHFEITSEWDGDQPIAFVQRELGKYKEPTNSAYVNQYALAAASKLMKLVEPKSGYESRARIQNWTYLEDDGVYSIHLNAHWKSEWYIEETMRVNGILHVTPDGRSATFYLKYINDPVRDLEEWQGQKLHSTIHMGRFAS